MWFLTNQRLLGRLRTDKNTWCKRKDSKQGWDVSARMKKQNKNKGEWNKEHVPEVKEIMLSRVDYNSTPGVFSLQ